MIDKDKLQQMLGGNPKSVEKFLSAFESESRKQLALLNKALAMEDWSMMAIAAHTIKTQCAYLGLENLVSEATEIEERSQQKSNIDELVNRVDVFGKSLIALIERELH